jgi:hypothetical protein
MLEEKGNDSIRFESVTDDSTLAVKVKRHFHELHELALQTVKEKLAQPLHSHCSLTYFCSSADYANDGESFAHLRRA